MFKVVFDTVKDRWIVATVEEAVVYEKVQSGVWYTRVQAAARAFHLNSLEDMLKSVEPFELDHVEF